MGIVYAQFLTAQAMLSIKAQRASFGITSQCRDCAIEDTETTIQVNIIYAAFK